MLYPLSYGAVLTYSSITPPRHAPEFRVHARVSEPNWLLVLLVPLRLGATAGGLGLVLLGLLAGAYLHFFGGKKFNVSFTDGDGNVIETVKVKEGKIFEVSLNPSLL